MYQLQPVTPWHGPYTHIVGFVSYAHLFLPCNPEVTALQWLGGYRLLFPSQVEWLFWNLRKLITCSCHHAAAFKLNPSLLCSGEMRDSVTESRVGNNSGKPQPVNDLGKEGKLTLPRAHLILEQYGWVDRSAGFRFNLRVHIQHHILNAGYIRCNRKQIANVDCLEVSINIGDVQLILTYSCECPNDAPLEISRRQQIYQRRVSSDL